MIEAVPPIQGIYLHGVRRTSGGGQLSPIPHHDLSQSLYYISFGVYTLQWLYAQ